MAINCTQGSNLDIDTSAEKLATASATFKYEMWIKAFEGNSGNIYVGFSNAVTAGSAAATDGYQLDAGEEMVIPVYITNDVFNVWVIGSANDQKACWMAY